MPPATEPAAAAFGIARPRRRRAAISLTPLIDVVFILLVFFMLASSFLDWRALDLGPPPVRSGAAGAVEGSLLVELRAPQQGVGEQGVEIRLAGERLTPEALEARLRSRLERAPEQRVLLRAGRGVPLQETVRLLDRLDGLGLQDLALLPPPG